MPLSWACSMRSAYRPVNGGAPGPRSRCTWMVRTWPRTWSPGRGLATLGPAARQSVGGSTAVFAALGAMSAYSWRERFRLPQRWARRWGPLIAGVILLGWTGSAGEGTDLVAHLAGFVVRSPLGATVALPRFQALLERVPQWLTGAAALASLAIAWACA